MYKPYANLVDVGTVTHGPRMEKYWYPVWVDIFPMDTAADNKRTLRCKHKICKAMLLCAQSAMGNANRALERILHGIGRAVLNWDLYLLDWFAERKSSGEKLTNYFSVYGARDISPISYYDDYQYMEFEGKRFRVPIEYDTRLSILTMFW